MTPEVRAAIARIDVVQNGQPLSRGTGTLVGPGLVLTALHVVADRRSETLSPYPGTINLTFPGHETTAEIYESFHDRKADWVLLRCTEPPPDAQPVPLGELKQDGIAWETFGFPDANPRDGMVQTGDVEAVEGELEGLTVFQLFGKQAGAGDGAPVKGLSGAPVLVDGRLAGVLRFALMRDQKTVAGTVYACPVREVTGRAPFLPLAPIAFRRSTRAVMIDEVRRIRLFAAGAVSLLVAAIGVWWFVQGPGAGMFDRIDPQSIVVLPFENTGGADATLVGGMQSEIVGNLYNIADLRVTSPHSAAAFTGPNPDYRRMRRELSVANVLDGKISQDGDRVRVDVTLSALPRLDVIWAAQYDRELTSIFSLQDEIALRIADSLRATLSPAERGRIQDAGATTIAAYAAYREGVTIMNTNRTQFDIRSAIEHFDAAVAIDSAYAQAWAALSEAHSVLYFGLWDKSDARARMSRTAAERAISLKPDIADGYIALGLWHYRVSENYDSARTALRLAAAREPNNSDLSLYRGLVQRRSGQWDSAVVSFTRASDLDPLSWGKAYTAGQTLQFVGDYGRARRYYERSVNAIDATATAYVGKASMHLAHEGVDGMEAARAALDAGLTATDSIALFQAFLLDEFRPTLRMASHLHGPYAEFTMQEAGGDTVFYYLTQAELHRGLNQRRTAGAYADSARAITEARLAGDSTEASYHMDLAQAVSALGQHDRAIAHGERAAAAVPYTRDAYKAMILRWYLTEIYIHAGRLDGAIRLVREQLGHPGYLSIAWMRADPLFVPLRTHPDFDRLRGRR